MVRLLVLLTLSFSLFACGSTPANNDSANGNDGKAIANTDGKNAGKSPGKIDGKKAPAAQNPVPAKVVLDDTNTEPAPPPADVKLEPIQAKPLVFKDLIRKDDRLLFVGDDITQQQYYTRALGSALMGYRPTSNLRIFNGGKNNATAETANEWVEELLTLTRPSVVFINFGINDGKNLPPSDDIIANYEKHLAALIKKVKAFKGIREVVVLSAPAIQTGPGNDQNRGGYNRTLFKFALSAQTMAGLNKAKFIDLFEPMRVVYAAASQIRGDGLTIGGRLPTEEANTVIASVILWGMGVDSKSFNPVGWAPIKAPSMGRIRGALGLNLTMPNYTQSTNSRTLYEKLREHDELFFQAWRLAGKSGTRDRGELMKRADDIWAKLDNLARTMYATQVNAN